MPHLSRRSHKGTCPAPVKPHYLAALLALCGQRMAAGSLAPPFLTRPWGILRPRLDVADAGAGGGRRGSFDPLGRSQGGEDHLTPLDGRWEERII